MHTLSTEFVQIAAEYIILRNPADKTSKQTNEVTVTAKETLGKRYPLSRYAIARPWLTVTVTLP